MRLLLDQNLSHRLVARLHHAFPGSTHVSYIGLAQSDDAAVWEAAQDEAGPFAIVSKDSDFNDLLVLKGPPPYVVWIQRGNCTTAQIETLLLDYRNDIRQLADSEEGLLIIS